MRISSKNKKNIIKRVIFYSVVIFIGLPLVLAFRIANISVNQDPFDPDKPGNPFPHSAELISLVTEDNVTIRGWLLKSSLNKRLIIIAPGFGMSHKDMINRADDLFPDLSDFFFLDHRGHGLSQKASITFGYKEALDIQAAVNKFRPDYEEIILWGFSMGAAASVRAALLSSPIDKLILEGMYDDLSNTITLQAKHYHIPYYPFLALALIYYRITTGVALEEMDMEANLKKLRHRKILLVHSRADKEVPMEAFNKLQQAISSKGKVLLLEKGGHEFIYESNKEVYRSRVIDFLNRE